MTKLEIRYFPRPEFADLVSLAGKNNIPIGSKGIWELFMALVAADVKDPILKDARVFRRQFTAQEIVDKKEKGERIPGNVFYHVENERQILNLLGEDTEGFGNYLFGCPDEQTQYTWIKKVSCPCGQSFLMEREWVVKIGKDEITKTEDVGIKHCVCGKQWIWIKVL